TRRRTRPRTSPARERRRPSRRGRPAARDPRHTPRGSGESITPPGVGADVSAVAVLSLHTSPLAQPGTGDSGGMNVYVRELRASLAQAGVDVRNHLRRSFDEGPDRERYST